MSSTSSALSDCIRHIDTQPFDDQKPGTSGLRKKVTVFQQKHYLANFVQSIFDALPENERISLVIGGDGRFFNQEAIQIIIKIALANGYQKLVIGQHGYLSTPAVSNLIRTLNTSGGIILSASHNPGGPTEDFGIKYNNHAGSPAPEALTEKIFTNSKSISQYHLAEIDDIDLTLCSSHTIGNCEIIVTDSVDEYANCMQRCFDFSQLSNGFATEQLSLNFDAMHAITGPYAQCLFVEQLGANKSSLHNATPQDDFAGTHPDPNLSHAKNLVAMQNTAEAAKLGAASDGDGDRNMILGEGVFVTPSDSLAVITEYAEVIPQFHAGLRGVARSMPTSTAVDRVAKHLGINCYETPTGWKFFGNLLDEDRISLCGEESFGTGGNHVREKDGIWAVLCWLTILQHTGLSVKEILAKHWQQFGRSLYCRHDFEAIATDKANQLMDHLQALCQSNAWLDIDSSITAVQSFSYEDPVDHSVSSNQGIQVHLQGGSRIIFRLSGTGTSGATLRMYLEKVSTNSQDYNPELDIIAATSALAELGYRVANITKFTGMKEASVIT